MSIGHGPEMDGNTNRRLKGCNCHMKIYDGYFDLSCPIHDKSTKLTPKQRKRVLKKILSYADSLDW